MVWSQIGFPYFFRLVKISVGRCMSYESTPFKATDCNHVNSASDPFLGNIYFFSPISLILWKFHTTYSKRYKIKRQM